MKETFAFLLILTFFQVHCQQYDLLIQGLDNRLKKGEVTVSDVLTTDSLMYLHPITAFREMIEANAKAEVVRIASMKEPGTQVTIKGHVLDEKGKGLKNLTVYAYQT